ncbi:MAG: HmuY family protein [Myxococcota bacterium]
MLTLWLAGCLPDLRGKNYEPYDSADEARGPKLTAEPDGDGITRVTVDATSATNWVYVDLDDDAAEVEAEAAGWDLMLSRQRIAVNGGVSGDGGVEVAVVDADRLEDVTVAPTTGYVADLADDDDENGEPEYTFDLWFAYDDRTHVLTPEPLVFVVATTDAAHVAIEIVGYYDEAGTSGYLQFRWKLL